ncbi:hypothetical protein BDZ89DRAFT_1087862 [Hymenopellis radicata]|nr:hypothetical protein BDZ89DRAFT_1087862 [Hymenopellis radicata]
MIVPSGASFWSSVEHHIDFEGQQQGLVRRAAVGQDRLQFVTEGEASLPFCITIIVDADASGTVDLSANANKANKDNTFEEIRVAPTECHLQGSVLVGHAARAHIEDFKLRNSKFGAAQDVNHMANVFDKSTKRTSSEPAYIRFGSAHDKDLAVDIRNGQLKLDGETVSGFFECSIQSIIDAIKSRKDTLPLMS